ncbi:retention module-containing protein, partial [Endozoicomonas sp.]|uniref:retention module-containing protein n=1 Tax=Endozoicomonas sp. TaxID=1892382 RepID=UPI00383AE78F
MDVISEVVSSKSAGKIHYAVGQVEAISPDGSRRLLKIGDTIFKNEMIVTGADGVIHIDLVNGQLLELSGGIETDLLSFFADSQSEDVLLETEAEFSEVQQAILAGADPTELLSAPAAGVPDDGASTDNAGFGTQTILDLSGIQGDPGAGFEGSEEGTPFGNDGIERSSRVADIDSVAPSAPIIRLENDTYYEGDLITSDSTLDIIGVEKGATVEYSTDGGKTWQESFAAEEGENTVAVRQTDVAGNVSESASITFTLDTSADVDNNFDLTVAATDKVTNATEQGSVSTVLSGVDADAVSVQVTF